MQKRLGKHMEKCAGKVPLVPAQSSTRAKETLRQPPRQPIMPPRQPIMPKRTAYYASEIKIEKNEKIRKRA